MTYPKRETEFVYHHKTQLTSREVDRIEIAGQIEAYLASGGVIEQLPIRTHQTVEPYVDPVTGYSLEQASAAGKRGARSKHGNRGNRGPAV